LIWKTKKILQKILKEKPKKRLEIFTKENYKEEEKENFNSDEKLILFKEMMMNK